MKLSQVRKNYRFNLVDIHKLERCRMHLAHVYGVDVEKISETETIRKALSYMEKEFDKKRGLN